MWPTSQLTDILGITYPIIQAPMAIVTTPALAAAVAKAGGLGGFGCAVLSGDEIIQQVTEYRALTNNAHPIHLNFFTHNRPERDPGREQYARELVKPFYDGFGFADVPEPVEPFLPFGDETLDAVLAAKAEVVSFHFGLPAQRYVDKLRQERTLIMGCATTVGEAKVLAERGVDVICAQGWEAGGHRGTFDAPYAGGSVGTLALVPQIVDAVEIPVTAAGGICDGRGIAAALALGASGVQIGTAFLRCPESNVTDPHRAALRTARDEDTRLTRAFSGGLARGLRNSYLDALAPHDDALPPFPLMNPLSKPLRAASADADVPDCLPLWAGQGAPMTRDAGAGALVAALVSETEAILSRLGTA